MDTKTLPPVKDLFSTSWDTFTKSLLSLFLLNILGLVIYVVLAILAFVLFIISGAGSLLLKNGLQNISGSLSNITPAFIVTTVIITVVFSVLFILVSSALQIASVFIVDSEGKKSVKTSFQQGFGLIIPLFLVGLLTFVIEFGALFVFILPAIIIGFLFLFVQFEVILGGQRWMQALKKSTLIVSKHFGGILGRVALLILIYIAISIIGNIIGGINAEVKVWVSILTVFVNIFLGWFALSYYLTLYKQARVGLENEKGASIAWMWIVAILGWIIAIGLGFATYKTISSGVLNNIIKKTPPVATSPLKNSPALPFLRSGQTKLATANQLAGKTTLTNDDKDQIRALLTGAIEDFSTAVEKDSQNYAAWYYRGDAYLSLIGIAENSDKFAIESFQKAIDLKPDDYNAYLALGGVYYRLKDYQKAIENFQKVTLLEPKGANGYFNLGMAYKLIGAKPSAKEALQKSLDLLPKNDPSRFEAEKELNSL